MTGSASRVPPFRDPRISACLRLPVAFRSLSRLSSALSAKASTLRPFLLNLRSTALEFISYAAWFSRRILLMAIHELHAVHLSRQGTDALMLSHRFACYCHNKSEVIPEVFP